MSTKSAIQDALKAKLETIQTAAGYDFDIMKVYIDDTPKGLQFDEFELPAIILVSGDDNPEMKHQCFYGDWHFELQVWNNKVSDEVMLDLVRNIYKAIFAGNATAQKNNAFKSMHPAIYGITPLPIMSDLNMIEANRCYIVNVAVKYTAKLWDL